MKKLSVLMVLLISLSLTACGNDTIPNITQSSDQTSSELASSQPEDASSNQSSDEQSSETPSKITSSDQPVSSKQSNAKSTSSKPVSSRQTSSKQTSSRQTSSRPPASSKPQSSQVVKPGEKTQFNESSIEQSVLSLVNQERTSLGLSKLTWNNTLYKSAKIRSDEMAKAKLGLNISHTRPNGTTWSTTLAEVGYSDYYAYAGENLAAIQDGNLSRDTVDNQSIAQKLFDGWKNSEGHYKAIIRPETKEIGIAVTKDGSNLYATQHFGQIK